MYINKKLIEVHWPLGLRKEINSTIERYRIQITKQKKKGLCYTVKRALKRTSTMGLMTSLISFSGPARGRSKGIERKKKKRIRAQRQVEQNTLRLKYIETRHHAICLHNVLYTPTCSYKHIIPLLWAFSYASHSFNTGIIRIFS